MPVELKHDLDGQFLEVHVSGKLTTDDYQSFVPEVERLIDEHGKIRVLWVMEDFHGWTAGALWEDVKFDLKHFKDVERLAMIGERPWEKGMAAFCMPFTTAEIKYFYREDEDAARTWIAQKPAKQPV